MKTLDRQVPAATIPAEDERRKLSVLAWCNNIENNEKYLREGHRAWTQSWIFLEFLADALNLLINVVDASRSGDVLVLLLSSEKDG